MKGGVFLEKYLNIIEKLPLFNGITREKIPQVLSLLNASVENFKKGQTISNEGDKVKRAEIVLFGNVQVFEQDYYGNRNLISDLTDGQLFGEALCCSETESFPYYIMAVENSTVLLFDCKILMSQKGCAYGFCGQFMQNLLQIISQKSLILREKITLLSKRTTREKLMEYLLLESKKAGKREFDIPLDRQQLADYLGVDRSAMSSEISKLQKDGIIKTHKKHFIIY